ncbi:TIGR02678 family protein [Spongiactinospora sp. TRM90649]|uniref:TIGR02678 family protein n=1 Tax=Spongiactinospora sp. TRM90649 TaxID=3031114 RepID=UPI0023F65ACB|nr:TIGR02678 family protein [Spongiactinospora sp. TRM90649]MDF5752431.1 TIGR02678 family protein [Spongiactinospora sp. TRM90649]
MSADHDVALAAERRAAVRLLLAEPLVTARSHPDRFPLVRRHAEWLSAQFTQVLGYRLVVEAGFARLYKAGLGAGSGRRLTRRSGAPFTPRAYAYLALTLSVLVTASEQLLLSELVARVRSAAAEAGIDPGEPNRAAERRALVAALRRLVAWEVLAEDDGTVNSYADDDRAEALVTVDRELARRMVAGPIGRASGAAGLIELAADPGYGEARHRVRRLLVETPVVYQHDLTEAEWAWLRRNQRREATVMAGFCGLEAEIRAEGVALVDPEEELTDVEFPGGGTVAWAALLLAGRLADELRPPSGEPVTGVPIPPDLIRRVLAELTARYGTAWSGAHVGDPDLLARETLDLLARMRLVGRGDPPVLLPAAARYSPKVGEKQ